MLWQIIVSIIRHSLTGVGATIAARGLASGSDVDTAIGAIMVLINFGHELYLKWSASKSHSQFPLLIGALLFLAAPSLHAQSSTPIVLDLSPATVTAPAPAPASSPTNSVSADLKKVGQDAWDWFLSARPFTTNGMATVQAGYGINSSSHEQIEAVLVTIPTGENTAIGFGGYHIGSEWADCSVSLTYSISYNVPLLGTVEQFAGDGPAWSFKQNAVVNMAFTGVGKTWTINDKLNIGAGVLIGNTSDRSGVDILGGLHLTYHY